ncbi:hypothetical protein BAE44_0015856 [Dichanthelium oligosanthes]|uniref:Ubiquitin-like domain-containing protein n=1 Tax=Dichanthelium oligosanthes TaxID=888268 RepID=A0A1E5VDK7_9POAL|nr:hypothetical protein BAE44_0015856 [Dichanthelium oligosanthes]
MRIAVMDNMMRGPPRTIRMEVEAGDTVASLMEEVQRRRRYPVAAQSLVCDGERMEDTGATLSDYNVTEGSKLELEMNMDFTIEADREERKLKKAKEMAVHVEQQQLADNENIVITVTTAYPILLLLLQCIVTIIVKLLLMFLGNVTLCKNVITSLGVDVERADAAVDKMQIFVRDCMIPCGRGRRVRTIVLEVEASDTVASVMAQVQGRLGYPPALQSLFYNGSQLLHDSGESNPEIKK